MRCSEIKVIKKDGTKEEFNVQKVVVAVNKSAERAMIRFSKAEINFICQFVEEKAESMDVAVGDKVAQGQQIGTVGSTGNTTGVQCHVEVRQDGALRDLHDYFPDA